MTTETNSVWRAVLTLGLHSQWVGRQTGTVGPKALVPGCSSLRKRMSTFTELHLDERILEALDGEGYRTPTPVQAETIPALMDGRDVMGIAQTGTGKTAAFALPILHHLASEHPGDWRPIRALMLTPTRELAAQIGERLRVYGRHLPLYSTVIFGGVGQSPQVKALRRGVDLLVATPGRLLDLHNQGHVDLSDVKHFVLDEADRMLDMGFSKDVERILRLMPKRRQNLMFSATMPKAIGTLANEMLYQPVSVDISPEAPTTDRIEQYVSFVRKADKRELLIDLLEGQMVSCGIVFTRTKHGANRLAKQLERWAFRPIPSTATRAKRPVPEPSTVSETARCLCLWRPTLPVVVLTLKTLRTCSILISPMSQRSTFTASAEQHEQDAKAWPIRFATRRNQATSSVSNGFWATILKFSRTSLTTLRKPVRNPGRNLGRSRALP